MRAARRERVIIRASRRAAARSPRAAASAMSRATTPAARSAPRPAARPRHGPPPHSRRRRTARARRQERADRAGQHVAAARGGQRRRRDVGSQQLAVGAAMTVCAPFRTTTCPQRAAASRAASARAARRRRPAAARPAAAAGARTRRGAGSGPAARVTGCHQRSPSASAVSPSASTTAGCRSSPMKLRARRRVAGWRAEARDRRPPRRSRPASVVSCRQPAGAMRPGRLLGQEHRGQLGDEAEQPRADRLRAWPGRPSPTPARMAPSPVSSAAPAYSSDPATTSSRPNVPLWARAGRAGQMLGDPALGQGDDAPSASGVGRDGGRPPPPPPSAARARSTRSPPRARARAARAAARAWRRTCGGPAQLGRISISRQPTPRTPRPSTLLIASLAAQRPAIRSAFAAAVASLAIGQDALAEAIREAAEGRDDAVDVDQVDADLVAAHRGVPTAATRR